MWAGTWTLSSLSGKGEVCDELRKRMINVLFLGSARMLVMKGRRHKLWCCGKGARVGGVGLMVEELCVNMVEVRKASDRVMIVVVLEEDVLWLICGYALQSRNV